MQKADELRKGIAAKKSEEKENVYWRNKNAEEPKGNVTVKSEVTTRDEDADVLKDEVSKVTVAKEEYEKNQNELKSLEKEKDKKDESKKPQSVPTLTPTESTVNAEVTTVAGASSVSSEQPVTDKSSALKQDSKKATDDRERTDANNVNRGQSGEGDVLAYETKTKSGGKYKKAKEEKVEAKLKAPQKVSGGYVDPKTSTSAPMPETQSQTKVTETQTEINGKAMDSVSAGLTTFGSTITTADETISLDGDDGAMIKYDKQDYAGAVYDFEKVLKQNPNDEKALYYSAVSYLSLGQTEKALTNLNKILTNKNSKYYDDAQWYSSLAYIKNNDMKNARTNLHQIQQNEKSRYKKQADETLEQIKK